MTNVVDLSTVYLTEITVITWQQKTFSMDSVHVPGSCGISDVFQTVELTHGN